MHDISLTFNTSVYCLQVLRAASSETHRDKRYARTKELNKLKRQWLTLMKLTNKGDIDGLVQLLPPPPSLMFDPVDVKAGCSTKEPVCSRRKHHAIFFFLRSPSFCFSYFRFKCCYILNEILLITIPNPEFKLWHTNICWSSNKYTAFLLTGLQKIIHLIIIWSNWISGTDLLLNITSLNFRWCVKNNSLVNG